MDDRIKEELRWLLKNLEAIDEKLAHAEEAGFADGQMRAARDIALASMARLDVIVSAP